ncbi:SIR2 family protein [Microbacterium hatanonis]|nr:SIR2 family protein [Microbacterium hatanonis]
MFLLGAGASADAGLATSVKMTRAIAERLGRGSYRNPAGQLLHAVIGAIVQHDTSRGGDAFDVPDVERVFSAVTTLSRRDSLDISAFVERWNGNVDAATGPSGLPETWAREFRDSLYGEHAGASELQSAFEDGVFALTQPTSDTLFLELERQMLAALVQVLRVEPSRVTYLSPLVNASGLQAVATLNYDLTIETASEQLGLSFDTGLDQWRGGYGWQWRHDVDVRLLKLHGSLDYALHHARPRKRRILSDHLVRVNDEIAANPAMVFGLGSKLRSDGPFLAMLVELDRLLAETHWLTIVGYSFGDRHINAALTRWINSDIADRISIVNPEIEKWTSGDVAPSYFSTLSQAASGGGFEFGRHATWAPLQLDLLSVGAAEGLATLHG